MHTDPVSAGDHLVEVLSDDSFIDVDDVCVGFIVFAPPTLCITPFKCAQLSGRYLERLVRSMKGRKVYLILDNLRVHHSKPVKQWLAEHQEQIAVHHLPSYSPELNPDERLNRSLKSRLGQLPAARNERELQKQIISQMRSCQNRPEQVLAFFNSNSTRYAA